MPGRLIKSLLIANRGEIACRIIRTARKMGIRTVAVYSDADAKALHVRMADEAVHIGPSPARESYLVGEKIIAAAKATKAQAIHPGYGFLSENADFAQAVIDAGLIWVGPKPDSIRAMGLKDAAKKLMADAGRAGDAGLSRRGPGPEAPQGGGRRDRLSGADQGGRGRRRQGHAAGRRREGFPGRARQLQARGGELVRRRPGADREIHPLAAPHRGAGVRRQPRQRRPPVRARLLAAAAPPEGDRGSARAGHGRGDARGGVRGGGARGQGGQLRGRGDDRVHRRRVARASAPTASGSWK